MIHKHNFSTDTETSGRTGQLFYVLALSVHSNHIRERFHFQVRSKENKWAISFLITGLCARTHIHMGEGGAGNQGKTATNFLQTTRWSPSDVQWRVATKKIEHIASLPSI